MSSHSVLLSQLGAGEEAPVKRKLAARAMGLLARLAPPSRSQLLIFTGTLVLLLAWAFLSMPRGLDAVAAKASTVASCEAIGAGGPLAKHVENLAAGVAQKCEWSRNLVWHLSDYYDAMCRRGWTDAERERYSTWYKRPVSDDTCFLVRFFARICASLCNISW